MIVVENVRKTFQGRTILAGVSVQFSRGQVSSLVGPSGGGKSTLLRCINGLERFDSGSVRVGELELGPTTGARPSRTEQATLQEIRRKVGMVFQHYGLFSHMTALQNVMEAPVFVRGIPPAEARASAYLDSWGTSARQRTSAAVPSATIFPSRRTMA